MHNVPVGLRKFYKNNYLKLHVIFCNTAADVEKKYFILVMKIYESSKIKKL